MIIFFCLFFCQLEKKSYICKKIVIKNKNIAIMKKTIYSIDFVYFRFQKE